MIAVKEMRNHGISLNRSLSFSGVSKAKWYHIKKPRSISLDSGMHHQYKRWERQDPRMAPGGWQPCSQEN